MPAAARKSDPTAHGGMIAEGSPDTFIGNLPAARLLDKHVCPLHGPGPITETSFTVFINGMGAARMGDKCTCMVPASGAGGGGGEKPEHAKFKLGASTKREQKWGEKEREWEKDGKEPWKEKPGEPKKPPEWKPKLSAELSREFGKFGNADEKGKKPFATNLYEGKGEAKASAEVDLNNLRNAKAEAGAKYTVEYTGAQAKGKVGNAREGWAGAEAGAEAKFAHAEASAGAGGKFEMKDGRLKSAYAEAEGKIGGSLVEGKVNGAAGFRIPFTNRRVVFSGEASGALATLEASAGAHAGYKDNKWSFGFGAKLGAAIAGLGFKFNVSIEADEPKEPAKPPPGVPGVAGIDPIAMGCMTVLIGGVPPPYIPGAPKFKMPSAPAGGAPKGMHKEVDPDYKPPAREDYEIAAKEGDTPEHREARAKVAKAFYRQHYPWMDAAKINSHVRGIDMGKPVEAVMVPPPDAMAQHTWPGTDPALGNYFALPGTAATNLGINPRALNKETGLIEPRPTFNIAPPAKENAVPALKTTAAPILDDWSDAKNPYWTEGGATQWNIPAKDVMTKGARLNING